MILTKKTETKVALHMKIFQIKKKTELYKLTELDSCIHYLSDESERKILKMLTLLQ